eukprot:CAMPEP_0172322244 /NCGR_PEP_ID=MMETSP1058-20130122/45408_1 /TAXON_ID=83371 /ORGANISM="Detonula confervacea, Strain CCMP 353" /LENGTH=284 /DNA_ID=CAMNT_0013037943 /DNA_START=97 /DNA_END=951 /DNA_ORIENTATION=+
MRVFSNSWLPLLFSVLLFAITNDAISSSAAAPDTIINLNNNDEYNELELEDEVMHETIATGRGTRDQVGEREEWSSSEHLRESSRFDTRRGQPISSSIKKKLQLYRLECHECDHNEAVDKINAFVLDAKRHAGEQARRQTLMSIGVQVVVSVALFCTLVYFFYNAGTTNKGSTYTILGGSGGGGGSDDKRRLQIEEQRRRAAARQEEDIISSQRANNNVPTWVDNEMKEVWTFKQEKQFSNAARMYGRMAPKARYRLIAENVDEKTKQECLMHHKLQQLIAKEQ